MVAVSASVVGPPGTTAGNVVATGVPGAPQGLSVVNGTDSGAVRLKWSAPTFTGGKAVDWYTIRYQPTGGDARLAISTSVKGDQLSLEEFGLPIGPYEITVVALSQAGTSPAGAPATITVV